MVDFHISYINFHPEIYIHHLLCLNHHIHVVHDIALFLLADIDQIDLISLLVCSG